MVARWSSLFRAYFKLIQGFRDRPIYFLERGRGETLFWHKKRVTRIASPKVLIRFRLPLALLFLLMFFPTIKLSAGDEHARLGDIYLESREVSLALSEYLKALADGASDAELYNNLGYCYFLKKNFARAEEYYLKAIEADKSFAVSYNNLGVVFHRRKNFSQAAKYYQAALKLQPGYAKAAYNLAVAYYRQGRYLKAARQYLRARKINRVYGEKRFRKERLLKSVKEELKKTPATRIYGGRSSAWKNRGAVIDVLYLCDRRMPGSGGFPAYETNQGFPREGGRTGFSFFDC